jgi:hypothetical protein
MSPTVFRYRRMASQQKKTVLAIQKETEAREVAREKPPQPDTF